MEAVVDSNHSLRMEFEAYSRSVGAGLGKRIEGNPSARNLSEEVSPLVRTVLDWRHHRNLQIETLCTVEAETRMHKDRGNSVCARNIEIFVKNFDGYQTQVDEVTLHVSDISTSTVFNVVIKGERWFKKAKVDENALGKFLKAKFQDPD